MSDISYDTIRELLQVANWESQGREYDRGYISALALVLGLPSEKETGE